MGPTPFYGARAEKKQKADFAMKQTPFSFSGDIIIKIGHPKYAPENVCQWKNNNIIIVTINIIINTI